MHLTIAEARKKVENSDQRFVELFSHGSLIVEYYAPVKEDLQKPHTRDEIYVIAKGHGRFHNNGEEHKVKAGDFLFVKAYHRHFFFDFSEDFGTWVFFYGPEGGE